MLANIFSVLFEILKSIAITIARAAFNTMNGLIISSAICWMSLGFLSLVGIALQLVFERSGIPYSGFTIAVQLFLFALTLLTIAVMFMGRFIGNSKSEKFDPDLADNSFDLLFLGYGCFISLLIVQVYLFQKYDPSIFYQSNVGLWDIIKYCLELTLLGFIPDVLQYSAIEPSLSPQRAMRAVQFIVKLLMAITIVSGTLRYLEARYKVTLFPF